jgi:hypothetical protein
MGWIFIQLHTTEIFTKYKYNGESIMTTTPRPIFDLSDSSEQTDFSDRISAYDYYSTYGVLSLNVLQTVINQASIRIYKYTRLWPKAVGQTILVPINPDSGAGWIGHKYPSNLTSISTTDLNFAGVNMATDIVDLYPNGKIKFRSGVWSNQKGCMIYPTSVTVVLDYGFVFSDMPITFKDVCIELVLHYLLKRKDQARIELETMSQAQITQRYRKHEVVEQSILSALR